ncbi:MAG: radical SAM protein [archaeon]
MALMRPGPEFPIKRVLLVLPPCPEEILAGRKGVSYSKENPLGLLELSRSLRAAGISAKVLDLGNNDFSPGTFEREILSFKPGIVGFSATIITLTEVAKMVGSAKRLGCLTVVGGRITSMLSGRELSRLGADAVVFGAGADPLLEMCKSRNWSAIPRVLAHGRGASKAKRPSLQKSRKLKLTGRPPSSISPANKSFAFIIASFGCPYSCNFCSEFVETDRVWQAYEPESVVKELARLADKGVKGAFFYDSIFGFERKWLCEFCNRMIETGIGKRIWWQCFRRVDEVDEEILSLMKRAGCNMIFFGVESGSDRVLKLMNKGITTRQTREAFSATRRAGIFAYAAIMLGYPGETRRDLELTKKLLIEIEPDFFHMSYFIPLPRTKAAKKGRVRGGCADFYGESPRKYQGILDFDQLAAAKKEIHRAFYLRPSRLFKILLQSKGSPRTLSILLSPLVTSFRK